jgi:hypothetical protein
MKQHYQSVLLSSFIFLFTFSPDSVAQKHTEDRQQLWLGYFNQTRYTKRFGTWADIHYRLTDHFVNQPFQFLTRVGLTYYLGNNVRVTAGYAYARHFEEGVTPTRNEHRPWQQLWWKQDYNGFSTMQWVRLEERYREKVKEGRVVDGYNFNYRIRYNLSLFVPLKGSKLEAKTPFFALIDEVFINMGKEVVYNYFDQNRFFIGFGYQFNTHLNAQLGYMNLFQQTAAGNKYTDSHAIRLFVFQTLDLRKQEVH